jgi:hypothetical protein
VFSPFCRIVLTSGSVGYLDRQGCMDRAWRGAHVVFAWAIVGERARQASSDRHASVCTRSIVFGVSSFVVLHALN